MKALGMLSGGLDSRLVIKQIQDQGIEVEALHAKLPFEGCCLPDCTFKFAQAELIKLHVLDCTQGKLFDEYMEVIRFPRFGTGAGVNPCIDCRIFMLKKGKKLLKKIGAKFLFTGEVLGERPMSQMKRAMNLIDTQIELKGELLRPLSAKLLEETVAEKKGWVDRSKLLDIQGRSRKPQIALAKKYKLTGYPNPAGGCLLCEKHYAKKFRDYFKHNDTVTPNNLLVLKTGRHFRTGENKIIVGRNENENNLLEFAKNKDDLIFEAKDHNGPITLLQGKPTKESIELAAKLTARYSDANGEVEVNYGDKKITVKEATSEEIEEWRI